MLMEQGTLELWFNAESYGKWGTALLSSNLNGETEGADQFLLQVNHRGQLNANFRGADGSRSSITSSSPATGAWNHVALSFDGKSTKLYLNGSLVQERGNRAFDFTNMLSDFTIASRNAKGQHALNGDIKGVRIFDEVLSADEIAGTYQEGFNFTEVQDDMRADIEMNAEHEDMSIEANMNAEHGDMGTEDNMNAEHNDHASPIYDKANLIDVNGVDGSKTIANTPEMLVKQGTLELWFNAESYGKGGTALLSSNMNGETEGADQFLLQVNRRGQLNANFRGADGSRTSITSGSPATGAWNHVALSFDGKSTQLYLNGALVKERGKSSFDFTNMLGDFTIGSRNGKRQHTLNGDIQGVKIFDEVLSADDIAETYQEGVNLSQSPGNTGDGGHSDAEHSDTGDDGHTDAEHGDTGDDGHTDAEHGDTGNGGHTDAEHGDTDNGGHTDAEHGDTDNGGHTDAEHGDTDNGGHTDAEHDDTGNGGHSNAEHGDTGNDGHSNAEHGDTGNDGHTDAEHGDTGNGGHTDAEHSNTDDGGHNHGNLPHPDDPAKQNEHVALLDLLPPEKATHRAIADGNWTDSAIWEGGLVPGEDADVFIPEGIAVTYDVPPGGNPELHYVRVNGELHFATNQDTAMKVDTLMTDVKSTFTIGTEENPMPAHFNASIEIADNGPITDIRKIDPLQLSRGVITHGKVSIQGAEKESHLVMKAAEAGDTTIKVEGDASGWQVGDTIVVVGTKYLGEDKNGQLITQDEEVTITDIDGNTLTLSQALEYDHTPPEGHEDLDVYVGNASRNIRIFSENSGIENQDDVLSRGHFMMMHNPNAVIRNAEFTDLGRTNKSLAADDATKNNHGKVVSLDPTKADNVRGRYSLHLHRTGATDGSGLAIVEGNAVNGSPGWGIVQHDSHAKVNDNFVYNIVGAGIVAETGNETGEWNSNLVTKVIGGNEKTGAGDGVNDFGNEGHAFENVSRLIIQQDNIAANSLRGWHFREAQFQIDPDPDAMPLNFDPFADKIDPTAPAILDFERNTAIGVNRGFDSNHRMNHLDNEVINDIEDFTAWEVANNGLNMYATNNYTFENLLVIGAENSSRNVSGIQFSQGVDSIIVNGGHFENLSTVFTGNGFYAYDATKVYSESALIDVTTKNNRQWFNNGGAPELLSSNDINSSGVTRFEADEYADFSMSPDNLYVHISGTVTDGLGERKYGVFDMTHQIVNSEGQEFGIEKELNAKTFESYLQRYGVFEDSDGLYTTLKLFMGDRVTGDTTPSNLKITLEGFERSYIDGLVDVQKPLANHSNLIEADSANTLYRQNMIDYGSTKSTDGDDYIKAEKGNQTVKAGKGNDKIFTGNGKDNLDGGAGNDEIWGFDGDDVIVGGDGADRLYGQLGVDRIYASVEDIIVNAGTHQERDSGDTVVFEGSRSDYQILSYSGREQFFVSDGKNQVLVQEAEFLEFSQGQTRLQLNDRKNPFEFDGSVDQQYYLDYADKVTRV
ncbi:MAG: hypothetical protein F6K58_08880 [Symploca sp. SIO2E9]|nr:hypothetical protein [Symploca sp. SIO2E9]